MYVFTLLFSWGTLQLMLYACYANSCILDSSVTLSSGAALEIPPESSAPGDPCTTTADCFGDSYCRLGFCVCAYGMVSVNLQCVPGNARLAYPGESCAAFEICTGRSFCMENICRCADGTSQLRGICIAEDSKKAQARIRRAINRDSFCSSDRDCRTGHSCRNGTCFCVLAKYCSAFEFTIEPAMVGEPCEAGTDCIEGSFCRNGSCACLPNLMTISGYCRIALSAAKMQSKLQQQQDVMSNKPLAPGDACDYRRHRCLRGSVCDKVSGVCKCPFRTELAIDGFCRMVAITSISSGHNTTSSVKQHNNNHASKTISGTTVTRSLSGGHRKSIRCPLPENPELCQLPRCFCSKSGTQPPSGIAFESIPQFVVLTFDDAVNDETFAIYKRLFDDHLKNANGCPLTATFFVSHEWTQYDNVQWLSHNGHDIAANSITHESLAEASLERWTDEFFGLQKILKKFSGIVPTEIIGLRAPQLSVNGDKLFQMMSENTLVYDNSLVADVTDTGTPFWPQTLDYTIPWRCHNEQCPQKPHPGIWQIPINQFNGVDGGKTRGAMVASAMQINNESLSSLMELLRRNFRRAYNSNKAPFVLTLNIEFLNAAGKLEGLKALETFIEETLQLKNVFFVNLKQLLQWLRQPVTVINLPYAAFLNCSKRNIDSRTPAPCSSKATNTCEYKTRQRNESIVQKFRTCFPCPRNYPWLKNAEGN